jgi:hypothetical protein
VSRAKAPEQHKDRLGPGKGRGGFCVRGGRLSLDLHRPLLSPSGAHDGPKQSTKRNAGIALNACFGGTNRASFVWAGFRNALAHQALRLRLGWKPDAFLLYSRCHAPLNVHCTVHPATG